MSELEEETVKKKQTQFSEESKKESFVDSALQTEQQQQQPDNDYWITTKGSSMNDEEGEAEAEEEEAEESISPPLPYQIPPLSPKSSETTTNAYTVDPATTPLSSDTNDNHSILYEQYSSDDPQTPPAKLPPTMSSPDDDDDDDNKSGLSDFVLTDDELDLQHFLNASHTTHLSMEETSSMNSIPTTEALLSQQQQHIFKRDDTSTSFPDDDRLENDNDDDDDIIEAVPATHRETPSKRKKIIPNASLFRYLRNKLRSQDEPSGGGNSSSSSEADVSCFDEDDNHHDSYYSSSDDSFEILQHEQQQQQPEIHWSELPVLPNHFCGSTNETGKNLDALDNIETANQIVYEHGTLLQAVLQLLAERDQVGVEGNLDSPHNIWKKGPLKKLSVVSRRLHANQNNPFIGSWNVKYVELRQGNLCYYKDSQYNNVRKMIHLRQDTIVQESTFKTSGFCFQVGQSGVPTKYFMASSDEDRQGWIKAIVAAKIGDQRVCGGRVLENLQPYQQSLDHYCSLREQLQVAESQTVYNHAIQKLILEVPLQVPMQWVRQQVEDNLSPILLGTLKPPKYGSSPQKKLKNSISSFWKQMRETNFSINGLAIPKTSQLASERMVGALTRCILEFDQTFLSAKEKIEPVEGVAESPRLVQISDLQAVSYARDILTVVLQAKERQDAGTAVKYLMENPGIAIVSQNQNLEVVQMEVSFAGDELPDDFYPEADEITAWVWVRMRRKNPSIAASVSGSNKWKQKQTFAVLTGTVLSFYGSASPRPHGLRGQFVINSETTVRDAGEETMETGEKAHVLCISAPRHAERHLAFDRQVDMLTWKEAVERAIDSAAGPPRVVTTTTTSVPHPARMIKGAIKGAADGTIQGGIRVIKGAKDGGIRVIRTATGTGFKVIRGAVGRLRPQSKSDLESEVPEEGRRPSLQMLLNSTMEGSKREPTVQCVIQMLQTFVVKNQGFTEHSGESSSGHRSQSEADNDGLITVQVKWYQAFLMSGGPSGRMAHGDALVELNFVETSVDDEDGSC